MRNKWLPIVLLSLIYVAFIPFVVQAGTITICAFDRDTYCQGETGYITATIYNDEESKIRVTELTATIDYYYDDENLYIQKFYTDATLPAEIDLGNSSSFSIPFSLPTNIAPGYTTVYVKAVTEVWHDEGSQWFWSDHPTDEPLLYIESPYKQQSEDYQHQLDVQETINQQLEGFLEEQRAINQYTTNMMYLFGAATVGFAVVTVLMFILSRRARAITQPMA